MISLIMHETNYIGLHRCTNTRMVIRTAYIPQEFFYNDKNFAYTCTCILKIRFEKKNFGVIIMWKNKHACVSTENNKPYTKKSSD